MIFGGKKRETDELEAIKQVALFLQRSNLDAFIEQQQHPWRLFWNNLVGGIARGLGFTIGAGLVAGFILGLISWFGNIHLFH